MTAAKFEISTDPARLDVPFVHQFLTSSYWAQGRGIEVVTQSMAHSVCFGGYCDGKQVAFGRLVTDTAVMAHVADVFVAPEHRGKGFGKRLVEAMLHYTDGQGIGAVTLSTDDAHGLYEQFGFTRVMDSRKMMRRSLPERSSHNAV